MSTKKKENSALIETQHNGVTMILEKKSNGSKAPTPEMQARMEAGKVEIMKVVEGVPGAEKLGELIERGKKKGNLSSTELMDVLEDMDLESDQMDKIYDTLENLGIDTVGEDYIPDLPDDADPSGGHGGDQRGGDGGSQLHGGRLRHRRSGSDVPEGDR